MEREEGGRAEAEPVRGVGREKILCYINMQSPGRSSDLDLELVEGVADTWWRSDTVNDKMAVAGVQLIVLSHFLKWCLAYWFKFCVWVVL